MTVTARPWLCPKCGPVEDALHGADEAMHCLECDAVVSIALGLQAEPTGGWRGEHAAKKAKLRESLREAQERPPAPAPVKPVTSPPRPHASTRVEVARVPESETKEKRVRFGPCSGPCKRHRWLLKRNPDLCTSCWHAVNPKEARASAKKSAETKRQRRQDSAIKTTPHTEPLPVGETVPTTSLPSIPSTATPKVQGSSPSPRDYLRKPPRKTREGPAPVLQATVPEVRSSTPLDAEIEALGTVSRAIMKLPAESAKRVMQYAANYYAHERMGVNPARLPDASPAASALLG